MVWSPPGVEVSVYQILNLCRVMDGLVLNSKLAVGGRGPSPGLLTDHRWRRSGPMSHHRLWGGMDHYVVVTSLMVVVIVAQSSTRAKDRYDLELFYFVDRFFAIEIGLLVHSKVGHIIENRFHRRFDGGLVCYQGPQ